METEPKPMLFKTITVTLKRTYVVPIGETEPKSGATHINGWTLKEVAKSWFKDFPLGQSHASRDAHHLGNGDEIIKVELDEKPKTAEQLGAIDSKDVFRGLFRVN